MLSTTQVIDLAVQHQSGVDVLETHFDELYEYYLNPDRGDNVMPYGTAKARTGDPYEWIAYQLGTLVPDSYSSKVHDFGERGTFKFHDFGERGTAVISEAQDAYLTLMFSL